MRSSLPKKTATIQRSNSQRGSRNQNSFTEDILNNDQENFELATKGFRNSHIIGRSDNTRGGLVPKGAKLNDNKKNNNKAHKHDDENELSSLSGFTASDNEEHEDDDLKFKMYPRSNNNKKNVREVSDNDDEEENQDEVHHDIMLNPKDDLKTRFAQLEMLKKRNEEEKRQREILGEREVDDEEDNAVPLKRPQSSYGALRGSENVNTMNSRGFMSRQKENMYPERPQTANVANMRVQEGEEKPITFKPVYTKSINQSQMEKKVFNYADKKFKTLPKKSDPVSRFNSFKNEWNKTKFLKSTGGNANKKEGRKLNLSVRNQTSKPDFIFHKYQPKYVFDV